MPGGDGTWLVVSIVVGFGLAALRVAAASSSRGAGAWPKNTSTGRVAYAEGRNIDGKSARSNAEDEPSPLSRNPRFSVEYRFVCGRMAATEMLVLRGRRPSGGGRTNTLVLLSPGFPGSALLYAATLEHMSRGLAGEVGGVAGGGDGKDDLVVDLMAVSWGSATYSGPCLAAQQGGEWGDTDIDEEARVLCALAEQVVDAEGYDRVVVVGHSAGCWIASNAYARMSGRLAAVISQVHLVCPFFAPCETKRWRSLPGSVARVARRVLLALPQLNLPPLLPVEMMTSMLISVQRWRGKTSRDEARTMRWLWRIIAASFVRLGFINALHTVMSGFEEGSLLAARPAMADKLGGLGNRLHLHFAIDDPWTCPRSQAAWVGDVGNATTHTHKIAHGFPYRPNYSILLAMALARSIKSSGDVGDGEGVKLGGDRTS